MRADRNDGGANRAGAARAFEDAVVACDRLTRTVVGGSVKRVAEEVVEWGDPVPEHAQHLRVLVHCVSLEPLQYRECYRTRRRRRGETGFCPRGQIRDLASYPPRRSRGPARLRGTARVDQHAEAVGREAEQAVGRPIDEGARVEEQEHRRQEAHEWRDQPQEAEALLHAVPGGDTHRQDRQDHQQDQERDALHGLVRIRDSREAEPER